ncbi:MAG TPA: hypothetical protein PLN31_20165 [Azoarcus taiwanensis]|nr:hypothetical protein [Azoarcus taiwanensis]
MIRKIQVSTEKGQLQFQPYTAAALGKLPLSRQDDECLLWVGFLSLPDDSRDLVERMIPKFR